MHPQISTILILLSMCAFVPRAHADAIVKTQAMYASTIAEFFIDQQAVRVELEIGPADMAAFSDLLPDEVYTRIREDQTTAEERAKRFLTGGQGLVLRDQDGMQLSGVVEETQVRRRIVRDEVTGEPLIPQPADAEFVLYVVLEYRFDSMPASLSIQPPRKSDGESSAATIGFVCYHDGLPINDFRYLPTTATLYLDWEDPWYSHFEHRNLRRQFEAPLSVFTYVEPYEVRQEIVVRPRDLQQWIDLDFRGRDIIPVDQQEELKSRVVDFLSSKNPLFVDGQQIEGQLDRISFIRRSLKTTGIIEPPEPLETTSATLGIIFVHPIESLPQEVSLTWDLFNERIQTVPAVASDEAGGLPSMLTPEDPVLLWRNYLTNPTSPQLSRIPPPPQQPVADIPLLSAICGVTLIVLICIAMRQWTAKRRSPRFVLSIAAAVLIVGLISWPVLKVSIADPFAQPPQLSETDVRPLLGSLLHNVYRAFDHHDESIIYDRLAQSVTGDLLSDVYLETRKSMELRNQGGMRISVKEVTVTDLASVQSDPEVYTFECRWRVSGWIGHWGHIHHRENEHLALITIADREGTWKITTLEMLDEQRVEPAAMQPSSQDRIGA